jgi:hypothetical protein
VRRVTSVATATAATRRETTRCILDGVLGRRPRTCLSVGQEAGRQARVPRGCQARVPHMRAVQEQ